MQCECLDCGKKIGEKSLRCRSCSQRGVLNHRYGKKWEEERRIKFSKYISSIPRTKEWINNIQKARGKWNHTEQTKEKISNLLKEKYKSGLIKIRKGFRHTEESRKKISKATMGRIPWNKGKKLKPLSKEIKNKISNSQKKLFADKKYKERIRKLILDAIHSSPKRVYKKERLKKMSKITKKLWENDSYRNKIIKKLKILRSKRVIPKKDTSIEIKIQNFLTQLHLEYYTHKYISEITHTYQCDIFIPVQNGINKKIVIECDGCYWHGCPICNLNYKENIGERIELDNIRTKELQERGFKVIRLWGHEIRKMELNNLHEILIT